MTKKSSRPTGDRVGVPAILGRTVVLAAVMAVLMVALSGCTAAPAPQSSTAAPSTEATAQPSAEPTPTAEAEPNPATTPPSQPGDEKLNIKDIKKGKGDTAKSGMTVTVHYTGWLTNGTKFDSSVDRGQPFSFLLGTGQVIAGWDQGVAGMKVGGVRELTIPPSLGYGAQGTPGGPIPPNATLKFEVELLGVSSGQ